jgi:hypothetical protein
MSKQALVTLGFGMKLLGTVMRSHKVPSSEKQWRPLQFVDAAV